jgi:hypothetical protein
MIAIGDKVRENWSSIVGEVVEFDDSGLVGGKALVKWPSGMLEWQRVAVLVTVPA